MEDEELYKGFDPDFLKDKVVRKRVSLPVPGPSHKNDIAPVKGNEKSIVHYFNYSLQLSGSRKFPLYTASNIDGKLFLQATRSKSWKKDSRVKNFQWGSTLYDAAMSDFDKGHMTKREDVQWSRTKELAQKAADSTFFYSNAVPQHKDLNKKVWKRLEDYILHSEAIRKSLKACVFTGPVLRVNDPAFVTPVGGESVQLPVLFWKVVVYPKNDGKLYRVGFLMSQKKLLEESGITEKIKLKLRAGGDDLFNDFSNAGTYQVNVPLIEELTDLKLPEAIDTYNDTRPTELVLEETEIPAGNRKLRLGTEPGYRILNISL